MHRQIINELDFQAIQAQFPDCTAVLHRPCASNSFGYRYEIIGPVVEAGEHAKVYAGLGTLEPQADGSFLLKKSNRVFREEYTDDPSKIDVKYQKALGAAHLHLKPPMIVKEGDRYRTFTPMRRLPGINLSKKMDFIHKDTDRVFYYALGILHASKKQVVQAGLIHGDINPTNILAEGRHINVIDFFDSKKIAEPADKLLGGMIKYMPPELYNESALGTVECDIYILGMLIAELFCAKWEMYQSFSIQEKYHWNLARAEESDLNKKFENLFGELKISPQHREQISNLLKKMLHLDPKQRGNIDEAIAEFEKMILERKFDQITKRMQPYGTNYLDEVLDGVAAAQLYAIQLRNKLDAAAGQGIGRLLTVLQEELPRAIPAVADGYSTKTHNVFMPEVFEMFVNTLGIEAFAYLNTSEQVITKAQEIAENYQQTQTQFNAAKAKLETLAMNATQRELIASTQDLMCYINAKLEKRQRKYPLSIDHLVILTRKLKKEIEQLEQQVTCLEQARINATDSFSSQRFFKPIRREEHEPRAHLASILPIAIDTKVPCPSIPHVSPYFCDHQARAARAAAAAPMAASLHPGGGAAYLSDLYEKGPYGRRLS